MKSFIFLLVLLGCSFKTHAQDTLAYYGFGEGYSWSTAQAMLPTSFHSSIYAYSLEYNGIQTFSIDGGANNTPTSMNFGYWPYSPETFNLDRRVGIKIKANPNKTILVDSLSFWKRTPGNAHPRDLQIRSSDDTYNTVIYSDHEIDGYSWSRESVILTAPITISNGEQLSFRFYAGGVPSIYSPGPSFSYIWLDNITVYGQDITDYPLPITLTSFDAYNVSEGVKLDWSTASEQNNHYFVIERSEDMRQWQTIDVVAGAGNSQQTLYYSTLDRSVVSGWYYYRLSQVDYDSQSEVFDDQVVPVYVTGPRKVLFPNPASVGEIVHIPPNSHVFDSMGRLLQSGMSTFIPLTSGLYLVGTERLIVK